jgi:lysophospholipase L1-like esterase
MFTNKDRILMTVMLLATVGFAGESPVNRESIEWCNVWITHGTEHALPRVLLIGDSITQAYYGQVETKLASQAYVGRLTSSKSLGDPALLDEVATVLKQYQFDVVHFNNGMHGWAYTEDHYAHALPRLIAAIKKGAPKAKLIWATTTPVREGENLRIAPKTERVKARNQIALAIVTKERIPVNDLFALVIDHPEFSSPDGVHASPAGISAQADQVAKAIEARLQEIQSR